MHFREMTDTEPGYAVRCAVEQSGLSEYDGDVVILSGDVPCIKRSTVKALCELHEKEKNACTLLSCVSEKKLPFGRSNKRCGR